jgi:HPt (histidine-containing phosphotransfer) domain-containing protein
MMTSHGSESKKISEIMLRLAPGYLLRRTQDLRNIAEAIKSGNFSRIQTIGHQLKGNAVSFGFDELSEIGRDLEAAAEAKDLEDLSRILKRAQLYLDKAVTESSADPHIA